MRASEIDETPHPGEPPADYVLRLAKEKAAAVAATNGAEELVLAADTTVVVDGEILGKPLDEEDARRILRLLAGREHEVLTGVALRGGDREAALLETTFVRMAPLTEDEIAWYAATREPHDKAGAYAAQGLGGLFIEGVRGNFSNVVGLPVPVVYKLFAALDYDLKAFIPKA